MRILARVGSLVIIEDRLGRIWLTKRKKYSHNNRRGVKWRRGPNGRTPAVRYKPIKLLYEHNSSLDESKIL